MAVFSGDESGLGSDYLGFVSTLGFEMEEECNVADQHKAWQSCHLVESSLFVGILGLHQEILLFRTEGTDFILIQASNLTQKDDLFWFPGNLRKNGWLIGLKILADPKVLKAAHDR